MPDTGLLHLITMGLELSGTGESDQRHAIGVRAALRYRTTCDDRRGYG